MAFVDNWRPRIDGVDDADSSAVNEIAAAVISNESKISKSNQIFSNALKGTATGEAVKMDDVSPLPHEMAVKVSSKNLLSSLPYKLNKLTYENGIYTQTVADTRDFLVFGFYHYNGDVYIASNSARCNVGVGERLSITLDVTNPTSDMKIKIGLSGQSVNNDATYPIYLPAGTYTVSFEMVNVTQGSVAWKDVMIERGATASSYEPYIEDISAVKVTAYGEDGEPTEYAVNADGTVDGVTALHPTTTLMTDTAGAVLDVGYNRDINKAFAAFEGAVNALVGA